MDTTPDTRMQTPATGPAPDAVERHSALRVVAPGAHAPAVAGSAPHGSDVKGSGLGFAGRVRRTRAGLDSAWSFGFDVRSDELPGPVPRGAPV